MEEKDNSLNPHSQDQYLTEMEDSVQVQEKLVVSYSVQAPAELRLRPPQSKV